jgi:UDPglucose 6-dehydrogenase
LCVGTPQADKTGKSDLSQLEKAISSLAPLLKSGDTIVGKSTVPVGTANWISEFLEKNVAARTNLVWNPEFLREGLAVNDTLHPDRIVLGVKNKEDSKVIEDVYQSTINNGTPIIITDFATAELVKSAANAFLATKISFINAFADLCDSVGADITTLADAIGYDSRIGRKFLNAGIGFGGGCLPKDLRSLKSRANELGLSSQFNFLQEVDDINQSRRTKIVNLAIEKLSGVANKNIAILGASFKPDSDDIRDSPALTIATELINLGANVKVHDPVAISAINRTMPSVQTSQTIEDVVALADLVLHLTEWKQYQEIDPIKLKRLVKSPQIIDGRNVLDGEKWSNAGWQITYLGRPNS